MPQTLIFGILLVLMLFWFTCGTVIGYMLRGVLQQQEDEV